MALTIFCHCWGSFYKQSPIISPYKQKAFKIAGLKGKGKHLVGAAEHCGLLRDLTPGEQITEYGDRYSEFRIGFFTIYTRYQFVAFSSKNHPSLSALWKLSWVLSFSFASWHAIHTWAGRGFSSWFQCAHRAGTCGTGSCFPCIWLPGQHSPPVPAAVQHLASRAAQLLCPRAQPETSDWGRRADVNQANSVFRLTPTIQMRSQHIEYRGQLAASRLTVFLQNRADIYLRLRIILTFFSLDFL